MKYALIAIVFAALAGCATVTKEAKEMVEHDPLNVLLILMGK